MTRAAIHSIVKQVFKSTANRIRARGADMESSAQRVEQTSAHWLRHTAGSNMANNNVDLRHMRDNLGHESISTTNTYLHSSNDARQFRQLKGSIMDKDRIKGAAHEVKGAVKEAVGKVSGSHSTEAKGKPKRQQEPENAKWAKSKTLLVTLPKSNHIFDYALYDGRVAPGANISVYSPFVISAKPQAPAGNDCSAGVTSTCQDF